MSNQNDDDEGSGESLSSTQSMILDLPPSCIEFCSAHPSYFLVGTYNLQKEDPDQAQEGKDSDEEEPWEAKAKQPQSRNGSIIVFQLRDGKVYPIQTLPQPSAVFDLHFQPHQERGHICATVSSTGTISFFQLTPPEQHTTTPTTTPEPKKETLLTQLSVLRLPNPEDNDNDDNILFTFFAWHPTIAGLMAITTATGSVVLVRIRDDYQGLDVLEESLLEHAGLEAWCVAFSCCPPGPLSPPSSSSSSSSSSSTFTVFSGGDDSKLRYTLYNHDATAVPAPTTSKEDENHDDHDEDENALINNNNRIPYPPVSLGNHDAGVTFILPLSVPLPQQSQNDGLPPQSHLVATGSYDEHLRVWAVAPLDQTGGARRAKCLAEKNLGGGVWRLNVLDTTSTSATPKTTTMTAAGATGAAGAVEATNHPGNSSGGTTTQWEVLLLASCMHAGSRIVRVRGVGVGVHRDDEEVEVEIDVLARFEEHKSMNYGSDWFRGSSSGVGVGGVRGGGEDQQQGRLCVSTSFYDRLLCVWVYNSTQVLR